MYQDQFNHLRAQTNFSEVGGKHAKSMGHTMNGFNGAPVSSAGTSFLFDRTL